MPEHTFTGPYGGQYPGERDLAGQPIGLVVPGDIRDLDGPLDPDWRETTDEDREALAARTAGQDGDTPGGEPGGSGEDDADGETPPAPSAPAPPALAPPAAPAAVPPAATSAGPAGTTPQEG